MTPSKDVTAGVAERILYGLALGVLMKLVAAGYLDADMAPYVAGGFVTLAGGAWAWWINRPKALLQSAAAVPGTTVVTTNDLAVATPNEGNIVSSETNKVIAQ
jgi:hypothetical protein